MAMMPASVMTMAMTKASRGRSMKMPENIRLSFPARRVAATTWPGRTFWMPSTMTSSPSLRPLVTTMSRALLDAGRDAPQLDLLRVVDHEHVAAGLIELDGGLRNDQRRSRRAPFHRDADDPTGDQKTVRVRQLRPHRHRIRRGVDLDVEEVAEAGMRIGAAVGQLDVNGYMRVLVGRLGDPALVVENIALARLKDHVDGVLADDRRQRPGRGTDQIADGEDWQVRSVHRWVSGSRYSRD